ncbi:MAG: hypothetical protein M3Q46_14515 [Verrucomicrobiota bacterium]|nr:hypothetical protein [Verrucomicrobiota bacterium]
MRKQTYYGTIALCALIVGALAITNQSLWIDEGAAALKAMEPSLGGWWHNLRSEGNSNLQLIGELLYLWGWEKVFGASEISLRASNLPFFAGGVIALAWGMPPRRSRQTAIALLALTNAFLWYYLSEARPYVVLFGFASVTAACLFRLLRTPDEALESSLWFRLFCVGLVGLCATSLIAVPWALGAMAAMLYWSGPSAALRSARRFKISTTLLSLALAILGLYYIWTLQLNARASDVARTGWTSSAFIFYELFGLAGLGPGRLQLRTAGVTELSAFAPFLAIGALAISALILAGGLKLKDRLGKRPVLFFLLSVALPFLLVLGAGVTGHMRLLGRHLTPLLPFLLALMAAGLTTLLSAPSAWKKSIAWASLVILLLSALEIRFADRHRRDDYRSAALIAKQAQEAGRHVWWLADISTGLYYRVPLDSPEINPSPALPSPKQAPDLVILSKPDIYDSTGAVRAYLALNHFKVTRVLPAFEIWSR